MVLSTASQGRQQERSSTSTCRFNPTVEMALSFQRYTQTLRRAVRKCFKLQRTLHAVSDHALELISFGWACRFTPPVENGIEVLVLYADSEKGCTETLHAAGIAMHSL